MQFKGIVRGSVEGARNLHCTLGQGLADISSRRSRYLKNALTDAIFLLEVRGLYFS